MLNPSELEIPLSYISRSLPQQGDERGVELTFSCLKQVMEDYGVHKGKLVFIPSIMALAKLFHTNHLEVHDALQKLHAHGYDYVLRGMDELIEIWYTLDTK